MCHEPRTSRVAAAISEQPLAAGGWNTRPLARPLGGRTGLERRLDGGGGEPGDAWHGQPPVPEVVYSAPDGHKGLVVREGQCMTQNDRREYVCAVNDPAGKHGRRDEHLAERCHVVLSVSPRLNAGITPICWKSSR